VFPFKIDRGGDVPHLLAGVPVVHLHQNLFGILCSLQPYRVVENPLCPVPQFVFFDIPAQWLAVFCVVCWQVAVPSTRTAKTT